MAETATIELLLKGSAKLRSDLNKAADEIKRLRTELNKLGQTKVAANLKRTETAARRAGKEFGGLSRVVRGLRSGFAALGIALVVRRMSQLVSEAINVKRAFDGIEQTLKAVTDSNEEYNRAQSLVFDTAKRLGLQITSLGTDYANFLASTKELDLSQRQIEKVFIQVSEAARVLNLPVDRVKLTFLALSQTASKGIATMEELRRQLGDQLPGILPRLAKELNLTTAQLFEMIRAGKLLAEEALPAIGRAAASLAGGQVLEASQQLAANLDRLGTASQLAQKRIIELAEPAINKLIFALTKAAENSPELERSLANIVKGMAALGEATLAVAPGVIKTVEVLSAFGEAINIIVKVAKGAQEAEFKFIAGLFGEEADFERVIILTEETADAIKGVNEALLEAQGKNVEAAIELYEKDATEREKIAKISAENLAKIAERLAKNLTGISEDSANRTKAIEELSAKDREEILRANVRVLTEVEIEAAEDRAAVADMIVAAAQGAADQRLATNESLVARLSELELEVASDFQAAADEILAGAQVNAKEREKLAENLATKLLKIEQNRIEKIEDAREDFEESIREGSNREDAEKALSEKIVAIFENETKKKITLLESFDKAVEKSVDKQIKLDQKLSAQRLKSLAKLREEATKVFKDLEELSFGGEAGDTAAENLKNLTAEFDRLQSKGRLNLTQDERKRLGELPSLIRAAGEQLQRFGTDSQLVSSGIKSLGLELESFSKKSLADVKGLIVGNADFARSFQELGAESQNAFTDILREYETLGAANAITESDNRAVQASFEAFGFSGKDAIGGITAALNGLAGATDPAQKIADDLAGVGQAAAAADPLVGNLATQIQKVSDPSASARIAGLGGSFATLATVLTEQAEGLEQLSTIATALANIATPLEVISANLPVLPPAVAEIVASLIELTEAKALEPLVDALTSIQDPVESLAENLPAVSTAVTDLVGAAEGSKEPLGDLEKALKAVGSKELVKGLKTATDRIKGLQAALVALAAEKGFAAVKTAAEDLIDFLGGPFEIAILNAAELISGPITDAFKGLATQIRKVRTDLGNLATDFDTKLPAAAERGQKRVSVSMGLIIGDVAAARQEVRGLINDLDELESKRNIG